MMLLWDFRAGSSNDTSAQHAFLSCLRSYRLSFDETPELDLIEWVC